jgi:hypothetical protein
MNIQQFINIIKEGINKSANNIIELIVARYWGERERK